MIIKKEELLLILNKIKNIVTNEKNMLYGKFILLNDKIYAFDNSIFIMCLFVPTGINGVVNFQTFYSYINKLHIDEFELSEKENKIVIKGKSIKASFVIEEIDDSMLSIIETYEKDEKKYNKLPDDFVQGIKFSLFSLSKESMHPLDCMCFKDDKIITSDNYRLTQYRISDFLKVNFLGTYNQIIVLSQFNPIFFSNVDTIISFKNNYGDELFLSKIDSPYLDISNIIKKAKEEREVVFPQGIIDSITRLDTILDDEYFSNHIELNFSKNKIVCKTKGTYGEAKETIDYDYDIDLKFSIHPNFLKEIIAQTNIGVVSIEDRKIRFETENFIHVISISVKDEKENDIE